MIRTAIEINPNLRTASGYTAVDVNDQYGCGPAPEVGQRVAVFERSSRLYGGATVVSVDSEDIVLAVEWDALRFYAADDPAGSDLTPEQALRLLGTNAMNMTPAQHYVGSETLMIDALSIRWNCSQPASISAGQLINLDQQVPVSAA